MIRALFVALLTITTYTVSSAATLTVPGIPSFNTNLGTLTKVTVVIDPVQVTTEDYTTNFSSIGNHFHTFNPLPLSVAGLGSWSFVPVQTSFENSSAFSDHAHTVDPLPSVKVFMGSALAWFLDPVNGVNSIPFPVQQTQTAEDHVHAVRLLPVLPQTTFEFTPVVIPEPTAIALLAMGMGVLSRRRR